MINGSANSQDELGNVLHICLELIESGEETIESLLGRYPEIKDLLRPPLEAALWLYNRSWLFDPNPAFVIASRNKVVRQVRSEVNLPVSIKKPQLPNAPAATRRWNIFPVLAFTSAVALLVFVGLKSLGFLVANSLPGDPLFRVKLANEELGIAIAFSQNKDAELSINHVEKRLVEIERIILSEHERFLPLAVLSFEAELHQARQEIAETDPQQADIYSLQLQQTVFDQAGKLDVMSGFYSEDAQRLVDRIMQITSNGMENPIDK